MFVSRRHIATISLPVVGLIAGAFIGTAMHHAASTTTPAAPIPAPSNSPHVVGSNGLPVPNSMGSQRVTVQAPAAVSHAAIVAPADTSTDTATAAPSSTDTVDPSATTSTADPSTSAPVAQPSSTGWTCNSDRSLCTAPAPPPGSDGVLRPPPPPAVLPSPSRTTK